MPTSPGVTGAELERACAAVLQASGHFVWRGVRDPTFQVFELDALGYRLDEGREEGIVVEAKSGRSGSTDLFKLVGLKTHLHIARGVLVTDSDDPLHDARVQIGAQHGIAVVGRDLDGLADAFAEAGVIEQPPTPAVVAAWRRCYRVEDAMIAVLYDRERWQRWGTIRVAKQQLQHLNAQTWIESDPWRQARALYDLYQQEPKLALRMAEEIAPGEGRTVLEQALRQGEHPEVQACLYLEHRKRLALALASTRCAALRPMPGMWAAPTPQSFNHLVEELRARSAWRLPICLQVFFLGFGGMVRLNHRPEECEWIGAQVGCAGEEVEALLTLFEALFPFPEGSSWFYEGYGLSRLKLCPVPIRGAGLGMREALSGVAWTAMATSDQLRVCGREHIRAADHAAR